MPYQELVILRHPAPQECGCKRIDVRDQRNQEGLVRERDHNCRRGTNRTALLLDVAPELDGLHAATHRFYTRTAIRQQTVYSAIARPFLSNPTDAA
jgi:hypothetical protein